MPAKNPVAHVYFRILFKSISFLSLACSTMRFTATGNRIVSEHTTLRFFVSDFSDLDDWQENVLAVHVHVMSTTSREYPWAIDAKSFSKELQTLFFILQNYPPVSACDVIQFNELLTKLRIHVSNDPLSMCNFRSGRKERERGDDWMEIK